MDFFRATQPLKMMLHEAAAAAAKAVAPPAPGAEAATPKAPRGSMTMATNPMTTASSQRWEEAGANQPGSSNLLHPNGLAVAAAGAAGGDGSSTRAKTRKIFQVWEGTREEGEEARHQEAGAWTGPCEA